jgi:tetratricopeptide (TPR) repeat protein
LRYAAGEATKAGLFADAANYYTRYLTHEPEDAAAWEALGSINQAQGDTLQALAAYQRALSLDKDKINSPLIINCLALSLERQDIPLAEVYLEALRREQGINSVEVQLGLFELSCIKGAYAQALTALTWLEAHAPDTLAEPSKKDFISATRAWQSAEATRIASIAAEEERIKLAELAQIQAEAEATEQARIMAEEAAIAAAEAAALNPPAPTCLALTDAAQAKADEGDYAAATTLYWKALAIDSSSAETWQSLSQAALKSGAPEQAEMTALEAQRRDNTNLLYTLNLLDIMQQSATPERLLEELIRAKEAFPQSIELTYDLAHGYETLGHNPRNAKILYEDYLNIAPADHLHREAAEAALLRLNRRR